MTLWPGIRSLADRLLCIACYKRRFFELLIFASVVPHAFAQLPTLTSAAPGVSIQGAGEIQMTLVGTNFRPGAIVVISPVLQSLSQSTGKLQAADITILSNTLINSDTMTARINVGTVAELGLRAIDVLNTDGTSTAGIPGTGVVGSSQPFHVFPSNSIAAPLTVTNLALLTPRDGTVAPQDEQLYAEAILTGSGTGTVVGQWIWDGMVFEEFTVELKGGTSATLTTKQSLPTTVIGAHQLQLRMSQPNKLAAVPITIVVNPDGLSRERLIYPEISRHFEYSTPPGFLWAPVPGAIKYQVGFSSTPYYDGITEWFDVIDNRWEMTLDDWQKLPVGDFYWTVRTIDSNGIARQPLPLRPITRNAAGPLHSLNNGPFRVAPIHALLQLNLRTASRSDYVTVSSDDTNKEPATANSKKDDHPMLQGQLGATAQWASGSNPPDTNVLSASERMIYQKGPWHVEANGSGLLNSVLNPPEQRTSHGQFNDYVFQLGYKNLPWSINFRFGIISPVLYSAAQFVTAATPRQGAELSIKSPIGTLAGFVNTNDTALGGGSGISFHQQIEGASYDAPLPKWAALRVMWLNANDTGVPTTIGYDSLGNPLILPNPIAPQSSGDVLGGLLKINFNKKWQWTSEYAISYFNPNSADPTSTREFGRAWRTGINGQIHKIKTSFFYREESTNFGNPANPSITESSQPNLRGANASITDQTRLGNFGFTYTFLDNNVHPTTFDEVLMNSFDESWSKPLGKKANVSLEARQTLTTTGTVPTALISQPPAVSGAVDSRDLSVKFKVTRKITGTTLSFAAVRDWFHDNLTPANDTITSSINASANLANPKSFFNLSAQFNANWVAADGATTGDSSSYSAFIQPSLNWKRPTMQLAPLLSFSRARTVLSSGIATSDTLTGQYGGRVSWTMPGKWKFSILSAQGSYNQNKDYVAGNDLESTQLLLIWTLTWKHKNVF